MKMQLSLWLVLGLLTATLTGCVAAIGNRDAGMAHGTTLGQQLIDLKKAIESGAITENEYQEQRAGFLKR
jgi:hypothetical protein